MPAARALCHKLCQALDTLGNLMENLFPEQQKGKKYYAGTCGFMYGKIGGGGGDGRGGGRHHHCHHHHRTWLQRSRTEQQQGHHHQQ